MNQIKAFVKSFTPYQKWYLGVVLAITVIFVIFFPDYMLEDTSNTLLVAASIVCVFWIPVSALSYWRWSRHQDEEKEELTVVKTLTPKQDIAVIAAIFAFAFLAGTLISRIPGASDSYVDALSSGFGIANGVLLLLRYREQWYAWIITLIMDAALYIRGGAYIMLVTVAAMMVNTCYGYWKWYRYNKTHADAV